jgi:hypothetical protein
MTRPDEDRFEQFARTFERLDSVLARFAEDRQFQVEKCPNRTPSRLLRRFGNPQLIIDIYQDQPWTQVVLDDELTYSLAAVAFYEPPDDPLALWKFSAILVARQTFAVLEVQLEQGLQRGVAMLESWTPATIIEHGQRLRNLKTEVERGLLG